MYRKLLCPDCEERMRLMHEYPDGISFIKVFQCRECMSDWEVTYVEGRIERIQRYYFG